MADTFRGDNARLCESIDALLSLDASGSLAPHGIGGHARTLLESAANRLRALSPAGGGEWEMIGYEYQHDETGRTTFVELQQYEWGWEKNNERWNQVGPCYRPRKLAASPQQEPGAVECEARIENMQRRLQDAALALADLAERNTDDLDLWEAAIAAVRNAVDAPGVAVDEAMVNRALKVWYGDDFEAHDMRAALTAALAPKPEGGHG